MRRSITSYYGCLDGTAQELCGSASPELHFFPSSEQSSTAGKVAGPVPQRQICSTRFGHTVADLRGHPMLVGGFNPSEKY